MFYKVKEVADMVGLSVRTLHHYDKIGLLRPDHLTESGYRQYSEENLKTLQQICFFKELDFPLCDIELMLKTDRLDENTLLDQHKVLLEKKVERLLRIIDTIDATKEHNRRGDNMSNEERFESFDMSEIEAHKKKYQEEAGENWGGSDAYLQSQARTNKYTPEDWKRISEKNNKVYGEIVSIMDKDVSDSEVQELVGKIRQYITEDYYDCTMEIFEGLGQMYVSDPRFTKNLDKHSEGFAQYLSDAIAYYCK